MQFSIQIIKEEEFTGLAENAVGSMLSIAAYFLDKKAKKLSKRFYVTCVKESQELEDFLDDHGARNNKTWVYFRELVASIRNFSSTAYMVSHILSRVNFYSLNPASTLAFISDASSVLEFLHLTITTLCEHLIAEAASLGVTAKPFPLDENIYEENIVAQVLPHNINDEGGSDIQEKVARVASELIGAHDKSQSVMFEKKLSSRNLDCKIIPERINEETLRDIETSVHNAQSIYDTYIQKTPFEAENPLLTSLRGHISVALHLLGVAKELSHFFERHEMSVRKELTRKKISKSIQRKRLLEVIVNFSLHYYTIFINDGNALANEVQNSFTIVESVIVNVPEGLGFHLRPSTLVAKVANHYGSKMAMLVNGKEFDATSVIDIMWAGGMIKKEGITSIQFRGDKNAVRDIALLAEANYGEDPMGNSTPLPSPLSYLRQQ
jgi:phosphotransferase system HPr-like phosphotransfer protein